MINIFQPDTGNEEVEAVKEVLKSRWIGRGKKVSSFEQQFALTKMKESSYFVSTNGCTQSIFISTNFFDFNEQDEIIVPTVSFNAVGNAVISRNSKLVLCDVDTRSLNATAKLIEPCITNKTKAIILNHYGGVSCDMDPIINLCNQNNILIIEDAACCPYSFYKDEAVGTLGDMGLWSFDAMKIITAGDGGMIYLNNKHDVERLKRLTYMGLDSASGIDKKSNKDSSKWWEFEVSDASNRCIMNDISASIGLVQLGKLQNKINRRAQINTYYNKMLINLPIKLPPIIGSDFKSSYYFYWIQTNKRDDLAKYLFKNGIYSTFRYHPLNRIKFFKDRTENDNFVNTEYVSDNTLCIPIHESLSDSEVDYIVDTLKKFYE